LDKKNQELAQKLANVLVEKKGSDVVCLDISEKTVLADAFIIASGRSNVQVKALCDEVYDFCKKNDINIEPMEGYTSGRWVIIDLKDVVVHIFHKEDREFYNLERLWSDASNVKEFA
jgi:ribosome-associated protein